MRLAPDLVVGTSAGPTGCSRAKVWLPPEPTRPAAQAVPVSRASGLEVAGDGAKHGRDLLRVAVVRVLAAPIGV